MVFVSCSARVYIFYDDYFVFLFCLLFSRYLATQQCYLQYASTVSFRIFMVSHSVLFFRVSLPCSLTLFISQNILPVVNFAQYAGVYGDSDSIHLTTPPPLWAEKTFFYQFFFLLTICVTILRKIKANNVTSHHTLRPTYCIIPGSNVLPQWFAACLYTAWSCG